MQEIICQYKYQIIAVGIIVLIGLSALIYYLFKNNLVEVSENNISNFNEIVKEEYYYVDIKGEVINPGVYKMESNLIVKDAITAAGGFTNNAYHANLNLSKKLSNEMVIFVSNKNEVNKSEVLNDASINISSSLININFASLEELTLLPGIGDTKASAIITYRTSNKFNTIEDILNVTGIGNSTYEQIKNLITV